MGLTNTEEAAKDYDTYVTNLKSCLTKSYELVSSKSKSSQLHQKKHYDKRVHEGVVQPGDHVLVKVVAWEGKHKIADRWEDELYTVLKQSNPDIPVYVVQREDKDDPKQTLHRILLLPINLLPLRDNLTKRCHADIRSGDTGSDHDSIVDSFDDEHEDQDNVDFIEVTEYNGNIPGADVR